MYKSETNEELNKFFQQYEECFNRLPCGICRLTNMPCPKITNYEPNRITCNHIGDPVDTKTTNHITSEVINRERFEIITDKYNYRCFTLEEVTDAVNKAIKEGSSAYIIRYYVGDVFKGGYNLEELKEKLGVK